jgi:hypothetical protein
MPSIRERSDFSRFGQATGVRRWFGHLSWLAALVATLVIVAWTLRDDERVYWARPVSSAHGMLQHDCRQCHVQAGAPLTRLVTLNDAHHSVRDQDCQQCHAQSSFDHSPRMHQEQVTGCVQCHREHSGREQLAEVADRHCTSCHANLTTTEGHPHVAPSMDSFAAHPEFFLWEPLASEEAQAARRADAESPVVWENDQWRDRTQLKFNHARHLITGGVLTAPPRPGEEAAHADLRQLSCYDCHVPDAAGQYMQPVNYEQHCASCHKLEFSGKLAIGGELPHTSPEIVFGLLRDRLMKHAEAHPTEVTTTDDEPRLPNKTPPEPPTSHDKWQWVESQLDRVNESIFTNVKQGCAYCHTYQVTEPRTANDLGFEIVPPNLPQRWLRGSRFDHQSHREVSCVRCHDPQFPERTSEGHAKYASHTQLTSEDSRDILMPKLETCRQCHGAEATLVPAPGVRARCVDCHDYHQHNPSGTEKLERWLKAGP